MRPDAFALHPGQFFHIGADTGYGYAWSPGHPDGAVFPVDVPRSSLLPASLNTPMPHARPGQQPRRVGSRSPRGRRWGSLGNRHHLRRGRRPASRRVRWRGSPPASASGPHPLPPRRRPATARSYSGRHPRPRRSVPAVRSGTALPRGRLPGADAGPRSRRRSPRTNQPRRPRALTCPEDPQPGLDTPLGWAAAPSRSR